MNHRAESLRGIRAPRRRAASASQDQPNTVVTRVGGPLRPELRQTMIAEAAYYLAQQRGFEAGHDLEDWLRAESQIDAALARVGLAAQRKRR